jgi:hypothetical protein
MSKPGNADEKLPNAHLIAAYLRERHEDRYERQIEIEVSGIDRRGNYFREPTFTKDVSEWGCRFGLSLQLAPNDIVSIRVVESSADKRARAKESLFQVLRVEHESGNWTTAAWRLSDESPWESEQSGKPEYSDRQARRNNPKDRRKPLRENQRS